MTIDPVLLLVEEIRSLEHNIHTACKQEGGYDRARMEAANLMVGRLRGLYGELLETAPTSAPGAAEVIRIVADRLPFAQGRYATHLFRIADRLAEGQRHQADLIWLRAVAEAMAETPDGGGKTTALLGLAVKGMAQPIVVWRAAVPHRVRARDLHDLSHGPYGLAPPPFVPQQF